jgi:hypothetical protein
VVDDRWPVGLIQRAIEQLEGAIRNGDMTHDGSYALTRHVLATPDAG